MKHVLFIISSFISLHSQCMDMENKPFQEEFNAIAKIYTIAKTIANNQWTAGTIEANIEEVCPEPNPFTYLTKQGIYVTVSRYPTFMVTPFGKIPLFKTEAQVENGDIILTQEFMKHFTIGFVRNIGEESAASESILHKVLTTKFYTSDLNNPYKKISKKKLEELRETSTLIRSNCDHCASLYEIKKIEGQPLPPLIEYERRRTYNEAIALYSTLKNRESQ